MNALKVCAAILTLVLATPTHAQDVEFSEIDVTIQLGDSASNALRLWPAIEADMEAIMRQRISTIYNPNGTHVDVSVSEISLDGETALTGKGEFNTLRGIAFLRDSKDGPITKTMNFGLRAQTWEAVLKDGMTVLPDKEEFYLALLNKFADSLVTTVNGE